MPIDTKKQTFSFTVDNTGKFEFPSPADWKYKSGDTIVFAGNSPFVVHILSESFQAPASPFVNNDTELRSTPSGSNHETQPKEVRGLQTGPGGALQEDASVQSLLTLNNGEFIARYRYAIAAEASGRCHVDTSKTGSWDSHC